ncbi:Putative tRNA wybutosine-synthesizing protein [Septoria linicola]|uniref:tRNA(Phe) 7-[(3-amino-3-carboxypropyl)-4-demethylwyosine(37)-N(4)]-methyltransferase n=1 Tax=Septoria linicola TaxID=215465 RepID=A0A9Q9AI69_9PEZI|nr:putative tRNA wybutosine-synthesizing protein [Septoria linicola]USW47378.1 Putative tRNA wybutosine-synthesizing protein [Septoria linicola]
MPKQDVFAEKKRKILQELDRPDEYYTDLSPIGSVDPNIRQLVDQINRTDGFVTTSSCAGRISVFLEGAPKIKDEEDAEGRTASSSNQGKGGGKWLYVSHDPVHISTLQADGALLELFSLPKSEEISCPSSKEQVKFVHFKFEPMILHVLTSSLLNAQHCYSAAMSAGFRESGIAGIVGSDPTPHVGVRTQGLALESIIAYQDSSEMIRPMVTEKYLRTLLEVANQRFVANDERKSRFAQHLFRSREVAPKIGDSGEWESAEVRRERKRAEGLRRRAEVQRQQQQRTETSEREEDGPHLGIGALGDHTSDPKGDPLPTTKPKMLGERGHGPVVHPKKPEA